MANLGFSKKAFDGFVLGADVGGTNTNMGLFGVKKNDIHLLFSIEYKSKKLKKLDDAVSHFLDFVRINFDVRIKSGCLAVAGVVNEKKDFARITNVHWDVDAKPISRKTGMKVILINDFEAVGYGINAAGKDDLKLIKKGSKMQAAPVAVVGAGTGLGRATLVFDRHVGYYVPISSESGHTDMPAQSDEEMDILKFIKKSRKIKQNVPFEMVLSGPGISNICMFYSNKIKSNKLDELKKTKFSPQVISSFRNSDILCKKTFEVFAKFYARFAKNCALDCLSYGGVYIAGGIAPKNPDIFGKKFALEFENSFRHKEVLSRIPVYLITNYSIGLLGSGFVAANK